MDIIREKIEQATGILSEVGVDVWLLFLRESAEMADPSFKMISDAAVVWPSAFVFSRTGERVVIVGRYDAELFRRSGLYSEVIAYDQGIAEPLRKVMSRLNPQQIALDYSVNSHAADGLSHGMFLTLQDIFASTPYGGRFVAGEGIVARLRGRKSATEIRLIKQAIDITESMFAGLTPHIAAGRTEKDIASILEREMEQQAVTAAWDPSSCPIVNAGASLDSGHAGPTGKQIEPGHIVHLDFGVRKDGFCADLQRLWYVRRPGERQAPPDVQRAFDVVLKAIEAGAAALKPGVMGWTIDEEGRRVVVGAGYAEFQHALGHQLGRTAHDGSTILGPRWERYGNTPFGLVEEGNVFTLELGVNTTAGMVALEEDVVVTAHGCEYLSKPQTELWYV
jgi:Xaa-Pro aminopeptidase